MLDRESDYVKIRLRKLLEGLADILGMVRRRVFQFFIWMTAKLRRVILVYVVSLLLAAAIMVPVEQWSFIVGLWWAIVASLTIGYGDYAPHTTLGRTIAIPLQYFWTLYCGLAIGGHIVVAVIKNANEWTDGEQRWLLDLMAAMYRLVRWSVIALLAIGRHFNISLPEVPGLVDGEVPECPKPPAETDDTPDDLDLQALGWDRFGSNNMATASARVYTAEALVI